MDKLTDSNFDIKIKSIQNIIKTRASRYLTAYGKATVIKSLIASK